LVCKPHRQGHWIDRVERIGAQAHASGRARAQSPRFARWVFAMPVQVPDSVRTSAAVTTIWLNFIYCSYVRGLV